MSDDRSELLKAVQALQEKKTGYIVRANRYDFVEKNPQTAEEASQLAVELVAQGYSVTIIDASKDDGGVW